MPPSCPREMPPSCPPPFSNPPPPRGEGPEAQGWGGMDSVGALLTDPLPRGRRRSRSSPLGGRWLGQGGGQEGGRLGTRVFFALLLLAVPSAAKVFLTLDE